MNTLVTILVAVLGALDIATLIMFFVTRHDNKEREDNGIQDKLAKLEKDGLRTQLLLLILLRPEERQEILTLGECYFGKLKGNWYLSSVFNRWAKEYNENPAWFKGDNHG